MEVLRVREEWQKAAAYYVRAEAMCRGFGIPFGGEFSEDSSEHDYVVAFDGILPVATCRLRCLDGRVGKIERVATIEKYRGKHYGAACIQEAERWLLEKGIEKVFINSRQAVVGFYEKLGYVPDYSQCPGGGLFECVMTEKSLKREGCI